MKPLLSNESILLTTLFFILLNPLAYAQKMYKWTDANGKVVFSDQVPPDKANLQHEELDKNAQVIKVKEAAKTKEELDIEKRLAVIKKQIEQAITQQKARDKRLLSSFLTVESMEATYKLKITVFNEQEKEMQDSIKKLEKELATLHEDAASYEKKNTKTSADVLKKITETEKKIAQIKENIKQLQVNKAASKTEFDSERARFITLTQSNKAGSAVPVSENSTATQPGLFNCDNTEQCRKVWAIAKEFVKANSINKITVDTDTLFANENPVSNTDLSLSVFKMTAEGDKSQLFLDIRCIEPVASKTSCSNPKAEAIRNQFNDYIKARLNPSTIFTPTAPVPPTKK